jgi:hypothetical protein
MSKHTPGPWELAPFSDGDEIVNVVKGYKRIPNGASAHWIAELDAALDLDSDKDAQLDEMYANARLIAAAPDLLAALRDTIAACAVAMRDVEACGRVGSAVRLWVEQRAEQGRAVIAKAEGR